MSSHTIIIRADPFGGEACDIIVQPSPAWASFDAERPTHDAARRYAEGLRTAHPDWKIRDETGAAT
jgi:hypothetical protein